jgi:hypothetical protein
MDRAFARKKASCKHVNDFEPWSQFRQLLRRYLCAKKVQTLNLSTKKLRAKLLYEKAARIKLVKFVLLNLSFLRISKDEDRMGKPSQRLLRRINFSDISSDEIRSVVERHLVKSFKIFKSLTVLHIGKKSVVNVEQYSFLGYLTLKNCFYELFFQADANLSKSFLTKVLSLKSDAENASSCDSQLRSKSRGLINFRGMELAMVKVNNNNNKINNNDNSNYQYYICTQ